MYCMTDLEIHFNAPKDATPEELAIYLDDACGGDAALRGRVETLFAAQRSAGEFMAQAPLENGDDTAARSAFEDAGQLIDDYKLLQKIGEGGFGTLEAGRMAERCRYGTTRLESRWVNRFCSTET